MSCEQRLRPWEEVIGVYRGVEVGEFEITMVLSCNGVMVRFAFPVKGLEANILKRDLSSCKPGTKIALMKTDEVSMPLVVRTIGTIKRNVESIAIARPTDWVRNLFGA